MKAKFLCMLMVSLIAAYMSSAQSWSLTGNTGTNPTVNFLGTTDAKGLVLRTNNLGRLFINKDGNIGIGIGNPVQKLDISGSINIKTGAGLYVNNYRMFHINGINGSDNIFLGRFVADSIYSGVGNVGIGGLALFSIKTGHHNTAIGKWALSDNDGMDNSALGAYSLMSNTTGYQNTAAGYFALYENQTGYNNTAVGTLTTTNAFDLHNSTALGYSALLTASNQVRIGNSDVKSIGGYVGWTRISDARVKKNARENVPGLAFINKLKPVTYNLDLDAADKIVQRPAIKTKHGQIVNALQEEMTDRKIKEQIVYTGFMAQDVERAAKELNYDFSGVDAARNNKDLYGLRYAEFVVPLAKAIQELSSMNDDKDLKIDQLQKQIDLQQKQIDELKTIVLFHNQPALSTSSSHTKATYSNAGFLEQNAPNPFGRSTSIRYSLPSNFTSAQMVITNNSGKILKLVNISPAGKGIINIEAGMLSAGTYTYSLIANGKLVDSKVMIVTK